MIHKIYLLTLTCVHNIGGFVWFTFKVQNEKIESRKKLNWWARFTLSMIIVTTFLFLIWLLFYGELPAASRDLINIMVGAYVAVLAKATDYWFKDKDDPEQKEGEAVGNGNNDTI